MQNKTPIVVGLGELLWDVFPNTKKAGGAPINFVYHATSLGARGYAVSAVGDDELGHEILTELKQNSINGIIATTQFPTGKVLVKLTNGMPEYEIVENVAWDHIPVTDEALAVLKQADAVCFGTLALRHPESRENILKMLEYANPDALKFYDVNLRQNYYSADLIDTLLKHANVFKINIDEMTVIRPLLGLTGSDEEVCKELMRRYNLKYMIFTAGEKFSIIYTDDEVSYFDTPKVKVADTVGAGDSFSAAFVYSILTGKSVREAHKKAVEISAFVCTKEGAWPKYDF